MSLPDKSHCVRAASLGLLALAVLSGCMTTLTQSMWFTGDKNVQDKLMVYSGTQLNLLLAGAAIAEGPFKGVGHGPVPGIVGFLDFPLSLVFDTVLLPLTISESIADAVAKAREQETSSDG